MKHIRTFYSILLIASFLLFSSSLILKNQLELKAVESVLFAQDYNASRWRRTRQGWIDLSHWDRPDPVRFERRIELIHPLTFSALLLLFSVGMMIWASEENHWAELISQKKARSRRKID